ncbi:hypothetical protein G9A89_007461, partial [Geosiphon pyriformis]
MNETDKPFPGEAIIINYFTKTPPKNWSYLEFLKSNRSEILVLPPFAADWTGLNGAWQGRFSTKAKENPQWDISKDKANVFLSLTNDAESLASGTEPLGRVSTRPNEVSGKLAGKLHMMQSPWQVVQNLLEGSLPAPMRIDVATNYEISSLELLDVAREKKTSNVIAHIQNADKAGKIPFDVSFDEYVDLGLERKRKNSVDDIPSDEEDENSVEDNDRGMKLTEI